MRLAQISTVLAAASIGGVVILYAKVDSLERNFLNARAEPKEGILDAEAEGASGARELRADPRGQEPSEASGTPTTRHATRGAAESPPTSGSLEERIARLEEKARRPDHGMPIRFSDRYARTVDDLAKQLSLTPTQRTRIEDAIARGKQRIEDVLKIPDETGKSPYERRAEMRKKIEEAMKKPEPGGMLAFATDLMSYRDKKIPGMNDTYSDEIERVKKETRDEIATALDSTQREKFQETNVDGLMGESGQVSFAYSVGGSGPGGESAEMIVEMGASVVDEVPSEQEPPAAPEGGR